MQKKILVIEPSGSLYGSEMVLFDILKNRIDPQLNYTVALPPASPFTTELNSINVPVVEILDIKKGRLKKLMSYIRLFFHIKKHKYDLIFVNQAGIQRAVSTIANRLKIPVVSEVSTLEDGRLINGLPKKYLKPVKSFICNSQFIANNLQVPEKIKSTLYYGYQWKGLQPQIRLQTDPFHVVLLGRISESKGHFLLVEAMKILKEKLNWKVKIFFVGDATDKKIYEDIQQKINKNGLHDSFVFRGFQRNINKELSDKNIMVIPSLFEPFGRIFCETAEAKLPAIVANSGGLGELSAAFDLGITFEGNNPDDLAKKLMYVMENYKTIKPAFEKKAEAMLQRLNMEVYIRHIETILINAMNRQLSSVEWFGTEK